MDRVQINVRITEQLARLVDQKRVEMQKTLGGIPSRSEVVRMAIEAYIGKAHKTK
jgi:metal-responsive CopG/Arc/MetJ family transcriptional regulator